MRYYLLSTFLSVEVYFFSFIQLGKIVLMDIGERDVGHSDPHFMKK